LKILGCATQCQLFWWQFSFCSPGPLLIPIETAFLYKCAVQQKAGVVTNMMTCPRSFGETIMHDYKSCKIMCAQIVGQCCITSFAPRPLHHVLGTTSFAPRPLHHVLCTTSFAPRDLHHVQNQNKPKQNKQTQTKPNETKPSQTKPGTCHHIALRYLMIPKAFLRYLMLSYATVSYAI